MLKDLKEWHIKNGMFKKIGRFYCKSPIDNIPKIKNPVTPRLVGIQENKKY